MTPTPAHHALYTRLPGQFLAFIHANTKFHGQPPAEAEMERHFRVSPPAIHDMILRLEKKKLISRVPACLGRFRCWCHRNSYRRWSR